MVILVYNNIMLNILCVMVLRENCDLPNMYTIFILYTNTSNIHFYNKHYIFDYI